MKRGGDITFLQKTLILIAFRNMELHTRNLSFCLFLNFIHGVMNVFFFYKDGVMNIYIYIKQINVYVFFFAKIINVYVHDI